MVAHFPLAGIHTSSLFKNKAAGSMMIEVPFAELQLHWLVQYRVLHAGAA